jgi:hypothetical protein
LGAEKGHEMRSSDDIGDRGESIFKVRITQPCGTVPEPLFRAFFLGEKKPTLDFMVELIGLTSRSAYCFVQVKTTSKKVKPNAKTLKVGIKQSDIDRMVVYPGPTYIVGIDENTETAYIISANNRVSKDLRSIPLRYPLDGANLAKLWKEVDDYWKRRNLALKNSVFSI